ncbi:MAG: hypothetical protein ACOCZQ_01410 [Nanoarchaeota archaeon]
MAESVTNKKGSSKKKVSENSKSKTKKKTGSATKTVNKKSTSKKNTVKSSKFKTKMPEDKRFVLSDGRVICSAKELALEIGNIGDDIFYYHVNEHKNDFSNWLRDVVELVDLSENLGKTRDKAEFQLRLLKYIVKHS